jgi:hypothetical protein
MSTIQKVIGVWFALNLAIPALIIYQRSPNLRRRLFRITLGGFTRVKGTETWHTSWLRPRIIIINGGIGKAARILGAQARSASVTRPPCPDFFKHFATLSAKRCSGASSSWMAAFFAAIRRRARWRLKYLLDLVCIGEKPVTLLHRTGTWSEFR